MNTFNSSIVYVPLLVLFAQPPSIHSTLTLGVSRIFQSVPRNFPAQLRYRSSKTPPAGGIDTAMEGGDDDDEFGIEDIEDTEP